jgi:hypothetical protein
MIIYSRELDIHSHDGIQKLIENDKVLKKDIKEYGRQQIM